MTPAPTPLPVVPSPRQYAWYDMEFYGFIHFNLNAWTNREWGYGDEKAAWFDPDRLDCAQWAATARAGGMSGLILTVKHHDGFCLYPSRYTEHSVKHSPWRNGKGDLVAELVKACEAEKLKVGIYLSPWDRNHAGYGTPAYVEYYRRQVEELLGGRYGEIFEFWLDGANGGDGYYGGAREMRKIDASCYYQWEKVHQLVHRLQPNAVIFSDGGPDIRWIGNERGIAPETCWQTFNTIGRYPGALPWDTFGEGEVDAPTWCAPELDVSIRAQNYTSWFHHEHEDYLVRTPQNLLEMYFRSLGRGGGGLLLSLPPARNGLIHDNDVNSLLGFRRLLHAGYRRNFLRGAAVSASSTWGGDDSPFGARNLFHDAKDSFWCPAQGDAEPAVTFELRQPEKFNVINLREHLALGQRVLSFKVEGRVDGSWKQLSAGTSIGPRRLLQTVPVVADAIRIRFTDFKAVPCLRSVGLHYFKTL